MRNGKDYDTELLRKVYYGSEGVKVAKRIKDSEPSLRVKNHYQWEMQYVSGVDEHMLLTREVMGVKISVVVYKDSCEDGLVPHLDVEIPPHYESVHLSFSMLAHLNEVIAEAKYLLSNKES